MPLGLLADVKVKASIVVTTAKKVGGKAMYMVNVDPEKCEGCGDCVESCPAEILSLGDDGKAVVSDAAECEGCEACIAVCTNEAVTVTEY